MKYIRTLTGLCVALAILSGCQNQYFTGEDEAAKTKGQNLGSVEKNEKDQTGEQEDQLLLPSEYFNQIEVIEGKSVIQNTANPLVLVNKNYYLSGEYIPEDLTRADVQYSFGDEQVDKALLRQDAAGALEEMFTAAKEAGIDLFAVSGYRSYDRQTVLYAAEVANKGEELAKEAVALPGQSEHQTGLAMDISAHSVNLELTQDFENVPEGQWLAENAHLYGFVLRYPKGKEEITGYMYEPWHFRYVGKEYSKEIYENGLTLEEYFETVKEV